MAPYSWTAEFCGNKCRMAFNNLRMKRGAELFDLVMTNAFGDKEIKGKLDAWITARLDDWRAEDRKARAGRPSWGKVDLWRIDSELQRRAAAKKPAAKKPARKAVRR